MSLSTCKKIIERLDQASIEYFTKEHPERECSAEIAVGYDSEGFPYRDGAKSIVIKGKKSKNFFQFILTDDTKFDQKSTRGNR